MTSDRSKKEIAVDKIFPISDFSLERVSSCNVCKAVDSMVFNRKDRYGFPVWGNICLKCGLMYLSPRLDKASYKLFYEHAYRKLVSIYLEKEVNEQSIQDSQKDYAEDLHEWIEPFILETRKKTISILDIGGSTGVVSKIVQEKLEEHGIKTKVTLLDPAPDEVVVAKEFGFEVIEGFIEDLQETSKQWDLILLCQTIDHLMDVDNAFNIIRQVMHEKSLFMVDIVDWKFVVRKKSVRDALKIDHPFNFTREMISPFLRRKGFKPISEAVLYDEHLLGFLCKKGKPEDVPWDSKSALELLDFIRIKQTQK